MTSRQGGCGCCSRKVLITVFAASGVILLVVGLVLSVGGVFSNIIKNKVDQASYIFFFVSLVITHKIWERYGSFLIKFKQRVQVYM